MMNLLARSEAGGTIQRVRTLQFGKMTWTGLIIVAFGWTLLLSGISLADIIGRLSGHASPAAMALSMSTVAQSTIMTGFGISILGLLQTGFGALNRFFDSVLERTAKKQETDYSSHIEPSFRSSKPGTSSTYKPAAVASKPRKIVERGMLKDRAYVLFGDGTIEVQTLLGLRRFQSMREAAEFIG